MMVLVLAQRQHDRKSLLAFRPERVSGNIWCHFLGCAIFLLLAYIVKEYDILRTKC